MYHPGSYLVYPTPIHLHSLPQHILSQQEASPPYALPTEEARTEGSSSPLRRHGSPPQPSTVCSRDLKFGMDRILSGDVSRKERPTLRRISEPASSHLSDYSMNECEVQAAHAESVSSPSSASSPAPSAIAPSLLRCSGDYPYRQSPPPPFPSSASRPHLDASSMGCGRPSYAAAAAAAAAAYSSYYPQFHQPGILPYASIYSSGGGMLTPHLEEGGIPVSSSAGGVSAASGGGKRKRSWSRAVFSNLQRKGLEKRFQLQKYITKPDRRQLAATLGLTDAQVKVWFQNRRMKWRHSKEGKQPIAEAPASLPSHPMHFPPEEEKMEQSSTDCNAEWEHQEMGSTERPDSTQKEMEEEIHVDS